MLNAFRSVSPIPTAWVVRMSICVLACMVAFWIECTRPDYASRVDEAVRDAFLQMGVDERAESRLVVVDISEKALNEVGAWPWSRSQIADLVETVLSHYRARAIALDIVLPEPADHEGDVRLAALAEYAPLTLAQIFDYAPRSQVLTLGKVSGGVPAAVGANIPNAYGYVGNHAGLLNARCVGNIGYSPDMDGVLRRIPSLTAYQGRVYQHLVYALFDCAARDGLSVSSVKSDGNGVWRVPYRYSPSSYTVVSAADVIHQRVPLSLFEGRYVLVGSSALGLADRVSTPLSPLTSGVMVHAAGLSGLLDISEGTIREAWSGRALILGWIVLSVLVAVLLTARLTAWLSTLVLLSVMLVWLGLAYVGVSHQAEGSISAPLSAYFVLLIVAIPHEWWRSQRSAKRLLSTFSHYVARPVLNELLRAGATYSLAPTLKDVTVLIADMEGYTKITSSLSLDNAATVTKEFLDCLTRPVLARFGTLDKYTGDGLVAFWGAPLDCPDQADEAVAAALEIIQEVELLNRRRAEEGFPPIRVRIGIESGRALVGDLGTPFRSTYTAVGDCINFASRLEEAARELPAQVIVGPVANARLIKHETRSLGEYTLRGTQTAIEVFALGGQ